MQHDRPDADEAPRLDRACLEMHQMADHTIVADDRGMLSRGVHTQPSCTLVRAPMKISPSSPRSTAPGQIELLAPIVTDPITTASGCTYASGWMDGTWSPRA